MPCNKREPGTGCGAHEGLNRIHAIFGWSEACVATYPGDMANALYAYEAVVRVRAANGRERTIPIDEFHRLPGNTPQKDTNLEHGKLIVVIELPKSTFAKNAYYLKVRDRASYAFALVAVAAALELDAGPRQPHARGALRGHLARALYLGAAGLALLTGNTDTTPVWLPLDTFSPVASVVGIFCLAAAALLLIGRATTAAATATATAALLIVVLVAWLMVNPLHNTMNHLMPFMAATLVTLAFARNRRGPGETINETTRVSLVLLFARLFLGSIFVAQGRARS